MKKNKILVMAIILTAALLVITASVVVANSLFHGRGPSAWEYGRYEYMRSPMHGFGRFAEDEDETSPMHDRMIEAVAEAADLAVEEIERRIKEGEHFYEIAFDAGISAEDFFQLMADVRQAYFESAVEDGWMTEEHYRWMQEHMDNIDEAYPYGGCHFNDSAYPPEFGPMHYYGNP